MPSPFARARRARMRRALRATGSLASGLARPAAWIMARALALAVYGLAGAFLWHVWFHPLTATLGPHAFALWCAWLARGAWRRLDRWSKGPPGRRRRAMSGVVCRRVRWTRDASTSRTRDVFAQMERDIASTVQAIPRPGPSRRPG